MSSSISRGLLILAGLCSVVPGSQAKDLEEMDGSVHDHEHHEYLVCQNIFDNVIDFTINLYQEPASWSETTNVLLSPVSIMAAFAILSLGTKGDTHMQILDSLKFNLREMSEAHMHQCFQLLHHIFQHPDHQLQLTMGNRLFISDNLLLMDQFVQDVKELYHSEVIPISFRDTRFASKQISYYVEKETNGEIVDLVKDLEEDTDLILVNYISFHGKWADQLQAEYTAEEDFYVDEDTTISVPIIRRLGAFFLGRDEELSSWVLVQHSVGDVIAFFILPDPGKMRQLEEGLTQEHFNNLLGTIDKRFARIHFPRLSMSAAYDLRSILSTLGITKIFSDEADLSGVTGEASIRLSTVVHKAMLTLDERETETVSTPQFDDRAWSNAPIIKFNRPFFLLIREESTKIPLFVGKVLNPTQQ
ncbi:alpha-1-antiproteinase 2-like [Octodon degus]|uniref:Alpha-1-antiproteinase 2-like n=1 Tax=Octodon degus TaxID=10160 RepID=A0A6P6ESY6_OCTDE|nr:alpha-1-antiproteinase 2-like [Octodon degus]